MMITRSIRILTQCVLRSRSNVKALQPVRKSSAFNYRDFPPESPKWTYIAADATNAFAWWWIFTHCWYQWGHVVGEYEYPEPEKWTDEELGVALE